MISPLLVEQQNAIINSVDKYIRVSAAPGSGKTYTVVKMIEKELSVENRLKGVIACSFTKDSAEELRERLGFNIITRNSTIGTIDSFVLNEIMFFANRYLIEVCKFQSRISIEETGFPKGSDVKLINQVTVAYGDEEKWNEHCKKLYVSQVEKWYSELKNGKYIISYPTYVFAKKIIESGVMNDYLSCRYSTMYIDEAQDLNLFQHELIDSIKENTSLRIVMVGDVNQSIYSFRGAKPRLFSQLVGKGYIDYYISETARCHKNIMCYADKIFNKDLVCCRENKNLLYSESTDCIVEFIQQNTSDMLFLVETNSCAKQVYEELNKHIDIVYSKMLDLDEDEFLQIQDLINECLIYFYNYNNPIPSLITTVKNLYGIFCLHDNKIKKKELYVDNESATNYLSRVLKLININLKESTLKLIESKLKIDIYINGYLKRVVENRLTTIHSAKGLEATNVVVLFNLDWTKADEEFNNKLYVAITRAKDKVAVVTINNPSIKRRLDDIFISEIASNQHETQI